MDRQDAHSTLIIGYGNTLRCDDGIGCYLAEQISLQNNPLITTLSVHQLTPELASAITEVQLVIFIDANNDSHAREVEIKLLEAKANKSGFDHTGNPAYLLALTQMLYNHVPKAWWVMIPAINFEFGETFSELTIAAIPQALDKIEALIQSTDL